MVVFATGWVEDKVIKIKLPRKRKKRMVKELGAQTYFSQQIISEILYEEKPIKLNTKFWRKWRTQGYNIKALEYY